MVTGNAFPVLVQHRADWLSRSIAAVSAARVVRGSFTCAGGDRSDVAGVPAARKTRVTSFSPCSSPQSRADLPA